MKIKSWYIALAGFFILGIYLLFNIYEEFITYDYNWKYYDPGIVHRAVPWAVQRAIPTLLLFFIIPMIIAIIPTLLLLSDKTKRLGATISIFLGLSGILIFLNPSNPMNILGIGISSALFLIAGTYYFWKKI